LIEGIGAADVIADKGYDRDGLIAKIESSGAEAAITPRSNCKAPRAIDAHLSKVRDLVERFVTRIEHDRRVANRDDKSDPNFLSFVHMAAIMVPRRQTAPPSLPGFVHTTFGTRGS
jgi:transposase